MAKLKGKARANARKKAQKANINNPNVVQWTYTLREGFSSYSSPDLGITQTNIGSIECLDILRNDNAGFKGRFKDKLGILTAEFTLLGNGKVKMMQDHNWNTTPKFMINELKSLSELSQNRVMNVDFSIYEFEYLIGAFNLKEQIKCSEMFKSLNKQYPQYTKETA